MTDKSNAEIAYLPPAVPPTNHGHTVAAWTAMIGIMLGALVAAIGVVVAQAVIFWVGMGVVLLACLAGLVLRNMGYGQAKPGVTPQRQSSGHRH
ncbi:HGxxPAAW family protein [Isoptericola variabilis]|uniref:Uncharacterized protein n=1 Tax=Isoptericola variabilis (strain 225) TaxID=743718 RepID=F6FTU3_ISOV2|nr:HGxxPAAW family protein [Isoptericola variabilis]AEG44220.1 hypothetical protein Isova_1459 [Isoptericola variabilis 225]TWH28461.1 hypothetical protein L600_000400000600 [Isoptericola variabilis J7]